MLRAVRLLNAIETGNTNGPCLDTLLCADAGRCSDFSTLMTLPGQTYVIASSPTAMCNIFNSNAATCVVLSYPIMCSRITCNPSSSSLSANSGVTQAISSYVNSSCAISKLAQCPSCFAPLTTGNNACFVSCFFSSGTALSTFSTTSCALTYTPNYSHTVTNCFLGSSCAACFYPYLGFQSNPQTYNNAVPYITNCTGACCCSYCINNMNWNPKSVASVVCCGIMFWVMQGITCCSNLCSNNLCCCCGAAVRSPSTVVSTNCGTTWAPLFECQCWCNYSNQSVTYMAAYQGYGGFVCNPSSSAPSLITTIQVPCNCTATLLMGLVCLNCVSCCFSCGCGYIASGCNFSTSQCCCCMFSLSFGNGIIAASATPCCIASWSLNPPSNAYSGPYCTFTTCSVSIAIANASNYDVAMWVSATNYCSQCYYYVTYSTITNACNACSTCFQSSRCCLCLANQAFCAATSICCTMILIPSNTACKVVLSCDACTFTCGTNNPCSYVTNIQQFFCVCGYLWAWPACGQTAAYSTNCGSTWVCSCLPYCASNWNLITINGGWLATTPYECSSRVLYSPNCGVTWYLNCTNSNAYWAVVCNSGTNNCWFSIVNCNGCVQPIF